MRPERLRPAGGESNGAGDWAGNLKSCSTLAAPADVPVVHAAVRVDLSVDADDLDGRIDRHRLSELDVVPAGASVIVWIGDRRRCLTVWGAETLHRHACRLRLTIEGTTASNVRDFLAAARTGRWPE